MRLTTAFPHLSRNDARLIVRDRFLLTMTVYILALTAGLRIGLPLLEGVPAVQDIMPLPLQSLYPLFVAFIAVFNGALLGGTLSGFVLLDEREDGTMTALLVTPLSSSAYLSYRAATPAIVAFVVLTLQLALLNGLAPLAWWQLIIVAAGGSITASLTALFFAAFAENKIQGFALIKFTGIGGFIVAASWFVAEPLQYLFGLFPPFWLSKAYWMMLEHDARWWAVLLIGLTLHAVFLAGLMRRFKRDLHRTA